jgi:4-amino-4-deoxy-L-arabinose transferase-like glycosyltransferase
MTPQTAKPNPFHNRAAFVCIFALALAVRLYHLTQPPLDFHPARQYRGAQVARGFYMPGNGRFPLWEQQLAALDQFQGGLLEPPVLDFIAAQAFKLVGGEKLWVPRLMSIFFWLIAAGFLYLLASRLATPAAAFLSLLFFLFLPYGILASRSFQPEPLMILLMVAALFFIIRYFENPARRGLLAAAAAFAAAALFIKPTCVFILFTVFGALLLHRRGLKKALADPAPYIFVIVSLLPAAAYYIWGFLSHPSLHEQAQDSFIPILLLKPVYWTGWLRNIGRVIGILPFLLALYGLRYFPRGSPRTFVCAAFLGYFIYGLAFNYHIHTHDYYTLQLVPLAALALGPVGVAFAQSAARCWSRPVLRLAVSVALLLLVGGAFALARTGLKSASPALKDALKDSGLLVGLSEKVFMFVDPAYYHFDQQLADQKAIGDITHHSLKTIYLDSDFVSILYNAEIYGDPWPSGGVLSVEKLKNLPPISAEDRFNRDFKSKNPDYFVISDVGEYLAQPDLVQFLKSHYPVIASQDRRYLIYQLSLNPNIRQ